MIARTKKFVNEVKVELQKATWPWDPDEKGAKRFQQLIDSTMVVAVAMLLLGAYVGLWDFILVNIVRFVAAG